MDHQLFNRCKQLEIEALKAIEIAQSQNEIEKLHQKYLGRKNGAIALLFKEIPALSNEEKRVLGPALNRLKESVTNALAEKTKEFDQKSVTDFFDVTVPGKKPLVGHIHPLTQVLWEITDVAQQMGYQILEGPEIENEWYNFEALNIPHNHPARDLQDTFWLKNGMLPRTHTSAMQVRTMEKMKPPIRVAVPGWVYRQEKEDATHGFYFHHFEVFAIDKGIAFSNLKGTLYEFLRRLLGQDRQLKFRASYFPYVEPCAEMSVSCGMCGGKGCKSCGGFGWLELGGAGMIHPQVLKNAGIDPEVYSGFAFAFGPGRIAMAKYGIKDIRLNLSADLRFLNQF